MAAPGRAVTGRSVPVAQIGMDPLDNIQTAPLGGGKEKCCSSQGQSLA